MKSDALRESVNRFILALAVFPDRFWPNWEQKFFNVLFLGRCQFYQNQCSASHNSRQSETKKLPYFLHFRAFWPKFYMPVNPIMAGKLLINCKFRGKYCSESLALWDILNIASESLALWEILNIAVKVLHSGRF